MINIINQPSVKTGCGIAVYAMLMDVSYEEALIFARKNEVCKDNLFITIKQMKKGLSLILNKVILSKKVLSWNEHKNYVCFCKYENSSTKHWILYYEGLFYDPLIEKEKRWPLCEVISMLEI